MIGDALGRQINHHPEKGEPTAGVAAKVDDQPATSIQFLNRPVDLFYDINADSARELRHLQPPDAIRYRRDQDIAGIRLPIGHFRQD